MVKSKLFKYNKFLNLLGQQHFYHVVTPSPWPFVISLCGCVLALSFVGYLHNFKSSGLIVLISLLSVIYILVLWLRDVVREGTYEGMHTIKVQRNIKFGFVLFTLSEIMFFFGFFWAYFHVSLAPSVELGSIWPPSGISVINPWYLPLPNTVLLLQSGLFITACHMYIRIGEFLKVIVYFVLTLACGIIFTCIQIYEYIISSFPISDSVYGASFFMLTGFHGFHVLCGTIFIFVCMIRTVRGEFTREHHVGFECSAWYRHSVDVVWLFPFSFIYVWGNWS